MRTILHVCEIASSIVDTSPVLSSSLTEYGRGTLNPLRSAPATSSLPFLCATSVQLNSSISDMSASANNANPPLLFSAIPQDLVCRLSCRFGPISFPPARSCSRWSGLSLTVSRELERRPNTAHRYFNRGGLERRDARGCGRKG